MVLERLYEAAWKVVKKQFLESKEWRNEMIHNGDKIDVEKVLSGDPPSFSLFFFICCSLLLIILDEGTFGGGL